jgi:1,2-phenylacetyl-CoA epoxidase catalytic subunit
MDKKQTAVEWFYDEMITFLKLRSKYSTDREIFKQAKEMEKEQIKDAYYNGTTDEIRTKEELLFEAEHFYKETYGGNK